eukprot:NODE_3193_length_1013_cov_66.828442_g3048_i0.p1 GENE.NODE_3193_length_1013_cov_66.828442_g3048_i0~~NODE_3193_length_1013_cov_66.828442_g3048_i0.p1  ORF type:complete len:262 (+),score=25.57 NODE_3193_length_1013_cov_66.828442_g3048_i0:58-843(+)
MSPVLTKCLRFAHSAAQARCPYLATSTRSPASVARVDPSSPSPSSLRTPQETRQTQLALAMTKMQRWVNEFTSRPNEYLGRSGSVCPYASMSQEMQLFQMESIWIDSDNPEQQLSAHLLEVGSNFIENSLAGRKKNFQAFATVVCTGHESLNMALVSQVQRLLRATMVQSGLMLTEMFPGCPTRGLHNREFRPHAAPVSALVLRHLQVTDLVLLKDDPVCLAAYRSKFNIQTRQDLDQHISDLGSPQLPLDWEAAAVQLLS